MTAEDRHTYQGMALVLAEIARTGEPAQAANLICGFGIDLVDFQTADVDSYDLDVIAELYRTEYVLKPAKAA